MSTQPRLNEPEPSDWFLWVLLGLSALLFLAIVVLCVAGGMWPLALVFVTGLGACVGLAGDG